MPCPYPRAVLQVQDRAVTKTGFSQCTELVTEKNNNKKPTPNNKWQLGSEMGPRVSLHPSQWGLCTRKQHHSEAPPADSLSAAEPWPGSSLCPSSADGPPRVGTVEVSQANPDPGTPLACSHCPFPGLGLTLPACDPSTTITRLPWTLGMRVSSMSSLMPAE